MLWGAQGKVSPSPPGSHGHRERGEAILPADQQPVQMRLDGADLEQGL